MKLDKLLLRNTLKLIPYLIFPLVCKLLPLLIPLHHQEIPPSDPSLSRRYTPNSNTSMPESKMILAGIIFPLSILPLLGGPPAVAHYALSAGLNELVTDSIKRAVGQPRPNFYDHASWDGRECTAGEGRCRQSRKSFPSGHSSLGFAAFVTVCLRALRRLDPRSPLVRVGVIVGCVCPAFYIAATRVRDGWHFPIDIVAGAAIGIGSAFVALHVMDNTDGFNGGKERRE